MDGGADTGGWRLFVQRLATAGRWITEREELPSLESRSSDDQSIRNTSKWLLAAENLPLKPVPVRNPRHIVKLLTEPENVPVFKGSHRSESRSLISWLLETEILPRPDDATRTKEGSTDGP